MNRVLKILFAVVFSLLFFFALDSLFYVCSRFRATPAALPAFHPAFRAQPVQDYTPYIGIYQSELWQQVHVDRAYASGWFSVQSSGGKSEPTVISPAKSPNTFRVLTLGGSTMAGWGQSDIQKSIPLRLQQRLQAEHPDKKIEVIVGAYSALVAGQELTALATKFLFYKLDLIVVMDGYNDFNKAWRFPDLPPLWGPHHEYLERAFRRAQTIRGSVAQLVFLISKRSYILSWMRDRAYYHRASQTDASPQGTNTSPNMNDVLTRVADEYMMAERTMRGIAVEHRIPILLVLQPNIYLDKVMTDEEKSSLTMYSPQYAQAANFFFSYARQKYAEFSAQESGPTVRILNLTSLFGDRRDTLYVDSCHYNDTGADLISERLARESSRLVH